MNATYHWTGPSCEKPIGHAVKRDATAAAKAATVAWRVVRVNFGRLYGSNWVALAGLGESCEALAHDGKRVAVRVEFDGQRFVMRVS